MIDHSYWYLARGSGIASYLLLSLSVIWGLGLSTRLGDRLLGKPAVYEAHRIASLFVLLFIAVHVASLMGDTYIQWDAKSLLIPFQSEYRTGGVAIGVITTYLTAMLTASFYLRRYIGYKAWRMLHYVSFTAYAGATGHGLMSGSDTKSWWMMAVYAGSVFATLFLVNLRLLGGAREPKPVRAAGARTGLPAKAGATEV